MTLWKLTYLNYGYVTCGSCSGAKGKTYYDTLAPAVTIEDKVYSGATSAKYSTAPLFVGVIGADIDNYTFVQPTLIGFTTSIVPRIITVTPNLNQSKVFGKAAPSFTFTHTPLIGSDVLIGTISRKFGKNAGAYTFTLGDITVGTNYNLAMKSSTFNIKKINGTVDLTATKPKVTPIDVTISTSVSGDDGVLEFFVSGEEIATAKVVNGVATAKYRPLNVGIYKVSAIFRNSANFKDTISDDAFFSITVNDIKPPNKILPFIPFDKSSSTVSDVLSEKLYKIAENISLPKQDEGKKMPSKKQSVTALTDRKVSVSTSKAVSEINFTEHSKENILTNKPIDFRLDETDESDLILADSTEISTENAVETRSTNWGLDLRWYRFIAYVRMAILVVFDTLEA